MAHVVRVSFSRMQDWQKLPCMVTVVGQPLWGLQRFPRAISKKMGKVFFVIKFTFRKEKKHLVLALDDVELFFFFF